MPRLKSETLRGDYAHSRMCTLAGSLSKRSRLGKETYAEVVVRGSSCSYTIKQFYITLSDNYEGLVAFIHLAGSPAIQIPLDDALQIIATREGHSIVSPSQSLYVKLGDHEL